MDPILASTARFQRSSNRGGKFSSQLPDTVVIHYTSGLTLESAVRTSCDPASLEHENSFLLTHTPVRLLRWRKPPATSQGQIARNIRSLIGETMAVALNAGTLVDCEKILGEAERQIHVPRSGSERTHIAVTDREGGRHRRDESNRDSGRLNEQDANQPVEGKSG